MAAIQANLELLQSSLLRYARTQQNPLEFLTGIQETAREAWMRGDEFATEISNVGSATKWIREIPASVLDNLCENLILSLEAETAAEAQGMNKPLAGSARSIDHSQRPCNLG